jgi:hypothetical protein
VTRPFFLVHYRGSSPGSPYSHGLVCPQGPPPSSPSSRSAQLYPCPAPLLRAGLLDGPRRSPPNCHSDRFHLPPVWLNRAVPSYVAWATVSDSLACCSCRPAPRVAGPYDDELDNAMHSWLATLTCDSTPLHTRAKSRDHEIVKAQKKVSKGGPNTPRKSCSFVVTHPPV